MNIIFTLIFFISINCLYAGESRLTFCSDQEKGWSTETDCLTSCGRLIVNGTYTSSDPNAMNGNGGNLSDGSVGFCHGQATTYKNTIRKIEIGNNTSGYKCTIFEGAMILDTGNASVGHTLYSGELKNDSCKSVIYDVLYLTMDRITEYAGFTTYPDGSGHIARTTSYCSTDNLSAATDLSWLDVMSGSDYQDNGRCYVRQTTYWSDPWKKAASSPTTTDFTNSSNMTTEFDDWKTILVNAINRPSSSDPFISSYGYNIDAEGYYLEADGSGVGQKLDSADSSRQILKIPTSTGVVNLFNGNKLKEHKEIMNNKNYPNGFKLKISKFASKRASEEFGIRFYFQRSGASAKFIGTMPADPGIYVEAIQPN